MDATQTAREIARDYNRKVLRNVERAELSIHGNRYMLVPTNLFSEVVDVAGEDVADMLFYRMGFELGSTEAKRILEEAAPQDPDTRILTGLMHFMISGLGLVNILELQPGSVGGNDTLLLAEYPDAQRQGLETGYAAGWLEVAVGSKMVARAVPTDDPGLRVLVAHGSQMFDLYDDPRNRKPRSDYSISEVRPLRP